MTHSNYLKNRCGRGLKIFVLFITGAFILSFNSCITYYTDNVTPQQFEKLENPEDKTIIGLITKDSIINTTDNPIIFVPDKSFFVVEKTDSLIRSGTNPFIFKKIKSSYKIIMADVLSIKTRDYKINVGESILFTSVALLAVSLIIYGIWSNSSFDN